MKKYPGIAFKISIFLTVLFSIYLFNIRISTGGDDAGYIESAKLFLDGIRYPSYHGAFYSIFLSFFIWIFGINLSILKLTSLLFITGHIIFFYYAFKNQIRDIILIPVLLFTCVNSEILYYASQTYTEAIYMFMQSLLFFLIIKKYEFDDSYKLVKNHWAVVLAVGFILFGMSLTRNIGVITLLSLLVYLILQKKYYLSGYTLLSFLFFKLSFGLYKSLVWGLEKSDISGAVSKILYADFYNPTAGNEDLSGILIRVLENIQLYFSKYFLEVLGFGSLEGSGFIALLICVLFIVGFVIAYKKEPVMKFTAIYLILSLGGLFIAIQSKIGQMRLIVVYVPLMLLLFLWTIITAKKSHKLMSLINYAAVFVIVIFTMINLSNSIKESRENKSILLSNINGNMYSGYSQDWINYLKLSKYAAENIPEGSMIACRKPSMSFIYGNGRNFYGIYRSDQPDSLTKRLVDNNVDYLLVASLRSNPDKKTDQVITTIHRYGYYLNNKYPGIFELVYQVGANDDEPARLYKINWDKIKIISNE